MPNPDAAPRPEHPRPDFHRGLSAGWWSLNGAWDFAFGDGDGSPERIRTEDFDRTIQVPFPWEAHAAWGTEAFAANDNWFSREVYLDPQSVTQESYREAARHTVGWYRRTVPAPALAEGQRLWLHIGAADWEVSVWVNGQRVADGPSGYAPFACDITEALGGAAEATIAIRVHDPQGTQDKPLGKQHAWYTTTSGIWQPVWLELRPERHITGLRLTPHLTPAGVDCSLETNVDAAGLSCRVTVSKPSGEVAAAQTSHAGELAVSLLLGGDLHPWSPDSPELYGVTAELLEGEQVLDRVESYFGLREIGMAPLYEGGPTYFSLNGKPIYLRGALDQSFNPWGVYAWRSDEDIIRDLKLAKEAGFNFLRIHIKPEDPRFLYWADRLGMLIMYDFPNLGYDGYSEVGNARWEWTFRQLLARDFNHPCIFAWVLFNETWGLGFKEYRDAPDRHEWVKSMVRLAKSLDPSRPVEDNSACSYDHVLTDINSWHFYLNDYEKAAEHVQKVVQETYPGSSFNYVGGNTQGNEPLLNSEYGGISARMGDLDVSWCFKFLTDLLRLQGKVCGYVYTELQDIEWEYNGIYNYDRSPKHFGYSVRGLQGPVYLGFDRPPAATVAPRDVTELRMFLNCAGFDGVLGDLKIRATGVDSLGRPFDHWSEERPLLECAPRPDEPVGFLNQLPLQMPDHPCLLRVDAEISGQAANWCVFEVREGKLPAVETLRDGRVVLRKLAGEVEVSTAWHEAEVERGVVDYETHLLGGIEAGHMDYLFTLPEDLSLRDLQSLTFLCEASSKRPGAPQTSDDCWPSDLVISMNGVPVRTVTLPDQYADSRGALSHLHGLRGRYGELLRVELPGELLAKVAERDERQVLVRLEVPRSALNHRGLVVYSSRAGRYPCDVTLVLK